MTPSTTSERAPMKQLSSMMVGRGLQRFEHAADADAARQMHVLADLRAGADRRPGVDHGAAVDVRADVHVARHEHDVGRDVRAAARDGRRHHARAAAVQQLAVVGLRARGILQRHLVEEARVAGVDDCVVVRAEVQQHGFLEPLVDRPTRRSSSRRRAPGPNRAARCTPRWRGAAPAATFFAVMSARRSKASSMVAARVVRSVT